MNPSEKPEDQAPRPGFASILRSVLGAALGVQSRKQQEADFSRGTPGVYIAAGLIFTVLFVLTLVLVVRSVLP